MNKLKEVRIRLEDEWRRVMPHWRGLELVWHDSVRAGFEREFWQSYEQTIVPALKELDNLIVVIEKAQREVK